MKSECKTRSAHLVLAILVASAAGYAEGKEEHGKIRNFAAVDAEDYVCTAASFPSYEDIPGMAVTFRLNGRQSNSESVIVMFQGRWRLPAVGVGVAVPRIRLVIDNIEQSGPGAIASPAPVTPNTLFDPDTTNGFNFVSDPLQQGTTHTAKIQWATQTAGNIEELCIEARSLVVLHR
jgi:hypothetical protein